MKKTINKAKKSTVKSTKKTDQQKQSLEISASKGWFSSVVSWFLWACLIGFAGVGINTVVHFILSRMGQ